MNYPIYTIADFACRLSELPIGTADAQQLLDFVNRLDKQNRNQAKRLDTAATLIGYQTITECMMDEDYDN